MTNDDRNQDRNQDGGFRNEPNFSSPGSVRGGAHEIKAKGTQVVQGARDVADEVKSRAKDVAGEVKSRVRDAAENVADKAEETKFVAGERMHTVAEKIRDGGEVVSRKADELGTYLQDHDFKAMGRDITQVVHRYPLQALLVGIGLGILLGRSGR